MVFCLSVAVLRTDARAEELSGVKHWIHLNGYTHHFSAPDANNNLMGFGFTSRDQRFSRLSLGWEADVFRDSGCKLSAYAGRSVTYRFRACSVGVTGALMYHHNFAKQNRWGLLPVALPFIETGGDLLRARLYYVPPVRSVHDHQIAIQMLVPWR
jgi:hypothetical protein